MRLFRYGLFILSAALALQSMAALGQENWPQFRGADSMGVSSNDNLPDHWSAIENVAWKVDVKGRGWASPIVWNGKIYLTTCVNLGETETLKKGLYFGGDRPKPPETEHEWRVICLDLNTGTEVWNQLAHQAVPSNPIHLKNSYASETPVTDGQRIYAYFGNVGVFCYELAGKPLWSKLLDPHKVRYGWGTAASPVVYQDKLFIINDNDEDSYLLALDARTGDELFRVNREEKSNWATPYIWKNDQRTEIVTPGTKKHRSYDLEGRLLWELTGASSITIALPYSKDGLLYLSSGYVGDKMKPIYAIKPGASGDITLGKEEKTNDYVVWSNTTIAPYNPSTILYGDLIYVLYDQGFFACYDAKTGEEIYAKTRIPEGKAFTASPWAYGGKIFCLNEDGVTFVMAAGKDFNILHTNMLAEDELCMATPAISGDKLLIRADTRLYCIKKGAKLTE